MIKQVQTTWQSVMDYRYNPLRFLDVRSGHYLMQVLSWMWSMIFSLSFLSIYQFGYVWAAHLLVIGGVFVTVSIFERSKATRQKLAPAPYLSRGANTVWQMDREA